MKLPADLKIKNTAHGHGAKGMAFYTDEDTAGLGVVRDMRRESGRHPFVATWRFRWLPNRAFLSFRDLEVALEQVTDEQVAAEKAKWPALAEVTDLTDKEWPNKCWRHRDRPAAIQACVRCSWIHGDVVVASLCAECGKDVDADDVMEVIEERRAAAKARETGAA